MFVVPVGQLLRMVMVKSHEELLQEGALVQFSRDKGNAIFVSHEWVSTDHPDPDGEQLKVLKAALMRMLSEPDSIPVSIQAEFMYGLQHGLLMTEMRARPLFVWYDFFSCPQRMHGPIGSRFTHPSEQELAIHSIPAYVEMCRCVVILCPPILHKQTQELLNKSSWSTRGWCRLERLAVHLSTIHSASLVEVQCAEQQNLTVPFEFLREPVGLGKFTIAADREKVAEVVHSMVRQKLLHYLRQGDLHNYRVLLNLQHLHFRGFSVEPIDGWVPGFISTETDPSSFFLQKFMYQHGFRSPVERDKAGWTPLCYAAVSGNPLLLVALLEQRANPNDSIRHASQQQVQMSAGASALIISVCLNHLDAIQVLLELRANPNQGDATGTTAVHYSCSCASADALRLLNAAGGSTVLQNAFKITPSMLMGGVGNNNAELQVRLIEELSCRSLPLSEVNAALHLCILFGGASGAVVVTLLEAGADIDGPTCLPKSAIFQTLMAYMSFRHPWCQTAFSRYAYHRRGATPLMCSIICGAYEAAAVLIASGARLDLRNGRGCSAKELAAEMSVPDFITAALKGSTAQCELLVQSHLRMTSEAF